MTRILCIGHPLLTADLAGQLVYQALKTISLPDDCELIDGGLQGLNLLRYFEDSEQVILVDSLKGFLPESGVVCLQGEEIRVAVSNHFDHSAGLAYLLAMLPALIDPLPKIDLIGIEGEPSTTRVTEAVALVQSCLAHRDAA